jgi:hypothetical protein
VAILIIASMLVPEMSKSMQYLLYVIPVLGVGAYLWVRRGPIAATATGTKVKSFLASGASVIGRAIEGN